MAARGTSNNLRWPWRIYVYIAGCRSRRLTSIGASEHGLRSSEIASDPKFVPNKTQMHATQGSSSLVNQVRTWVLWRSVLYHAVPAGGFGD